MSNKNLVAMAIVAALSTGVGAAHMTPVLAADSQTKDAVTKSTETTAEKTADQDFLKVSEDALLTMRNVHGARLAIFSGLPDKAKTYADAAVAEVEATIKDADKYAVDIKEPMRGDEMYVPFDASLTVSERFVPTEEKMKHIATANKHLHKGEKKEAMQALKRGEIDVAIAAKVVPVKLAQQHIAEAAKLIGEGKYYEANLALKAIEDAVVVDTFAIDTPPKAKAKAKAKN